MAGDPLQRRVGDRGDRGSPFRTPRPRVPGRGAATRVPGRVFDVAASTMPLRVSWSRAVDDGARDYCAWRWQSVRSAGNGASRPDSSGPTHRQKLTRSRVRGGRGRSGSAALRSAAASRCSPSRSAWHWPEVTAQQQDRTARSSAASRRPPRERQEQSAERDRHQIETMTAEAKEIAEAMQPTLAAFDEALRKGTRPTPASDQWLDKADDVAEQFRRTESGWNEYQRRAGGASRSARGPRHRDLDLPTGRERRARRVDRPGAHTA